MIFQSIRAQLRSNVMKVLTSDLTKNTVHPNVKFAGTSNGLLMYLPMEWTILMDCCHQGGSC